MDISEIWDNFAFLAAPLVALFLVFLSLRIRKRWIRFPAFALSALVFIGAGLLLMLQGYFLFGSTARRPGIVSPDGKHVAVVRWNLVGAVGSDRVHVSIRSKYSPVATEVYTDLAMDSPDEPDVRWLDSHRLLIIFWEHGKIAKCLPEPDKVEGIEVLCQE